MPELRKYLLLFITSFFILNLFLIGCGKKSQWYKGNLHTHSFWSDGDDYPEMVMKWYKEHNYHFIALTDHNILAQGEKWLNVQKRKDGAEIYEKYLQSFGADWIEKKEEDGGSLVRLKTLEEYKLLFEEAEKFLIIKSEEITDRFERKPIHINAINLREYIPPQRGNSVLEVMQNNVNAILEQRDATGAAILSQLTHPNFGWAVTAEDIIALQGEKFFEIYNGHPAVRNEGDELHPGVERIWDIVLAQRLAIGGQILYGIAVDDAHNFHVSSSKHANPGRGWILVRAAKLTPESIIEAMESGTFYASTGVELEDIRYEQGEISINIKPEDGISYTTQFIGTRRGFDARSEPVNDATLNAQVTRRYSDEIGIVLAEVKGITASYKFKNDELYVRAKIISTKLKENPNHEGEYEVAWTQPYIINKM